MGRKQLEGKQILIMGFLTHLFVFSTLVLTVSGMKYKCHRDICDSSYQFCNDGEERCNTCTPEQCQDDVAKHIFYQCEVRCQELATTTARSTEPTTTSAAIVTAQDKPEEPHFLTWLTPVILTAGIVVIVLILILVLWYVVRIDRKVFDPEMAGSETCTTISTTGDVEKAPLLEQGIQVVQNEESDSGAHLNKMEEIRTLAQAPAQAAAVVVQPDQADPPSYTTSDLKNNKTPTMASVASVEAVQDSGLQDYLSETIPETDFLQQNFKKEKENEKDIGVENTRLKSVQNQSHLKF
ncbi:uncharacterized protein LOC124263218 [Haliotis rubra]|uniref:uncharacterized protein LOC124263218 n=1 Tax=Haliotis rubra TaxID=36100 RepID=UPI001EE617AE|nr:uncharacterized protein LOC124263218 [Haliotis rubra]